MSDEPEFVNGGMKRSLSPALTLDEIHVMEKEPPPYPNRMLQYQQIQPVLTQEQYNRLKGCYLLPEHGPNEVQPNIAYWARDPETGKPQFKILLLPRVLFHQYMRAKLVLERAKWGTATRESANGQPSPKKITYGFYPQKPGHVEGNGWYSVRNEASLRQPNLAHGLKPLVRAMDAALAEYLPTYYPKAQDDAMGAIRREGEEDDWSQIPKAPFPDFNAEKLVRDMGDDTWVNGPFDPTYTLWGTVFSTLELNNHILFKAHEDAYNVDGALVCIAALGNWAGGRLIFPRYGFGCNLKPFDLLIADNHFELHGNTGPLVGQRFSVVAFLHTNVLDYAKRQGLWREKNDASSTEG